MELKQEELEKIELHSSEVQEILSRPPKWITRWGITIIFIVVLIIIVGSWFFKYPDVIAADIVLTTENPPAPIVAKTFGKLQNLFVEDNEIVAEGQALGVIENPGKYKSVQKLQEVLNCSNSELINEEILNLSNRPLTLGEIQPFYASFSKQIKEYSNQINLNYYNQKIDLYKKELKKYDLYLKNLNNQHNILKEELELAKNQFKRDSVLFSQELLSDSDFENSRATILSKLYNYEQNKISITNVEIQVENLNQSIVELNLQKKKQTNDFEISIKELYENLISSIDNWYHKYVLIASTNGKVTFNKFWDENQNVKAGETVMTIVPNEEGEIIGKVQLSFSGAGKVKVNQKVNIQFANYPHMEFGMVKGIVNSISLAPDNNFYTTEIRLPNGLKTFYDIELEFKQEMQGTAEIITEEFRLLEKIVRPLRYILKKNT